jgi:HSP20 family protein
MNALIRYSNPMAAVSDWIDEVFGGNLFEAADRQLTSGNWPRVDIEERENAYTIKADLPGLDKKDVSVTIENGALRIEGEKKQEYKQEKEKYCHFERSYGKFCRTFALPDSVEAEKIDASMKNGVLELTLPKKEQARPKAIEVKVN